MTEPMEKTTPGVRVNPIATGPCFDMDEQIDIGLRGHFKLEAYAGELRYDAEGHILNERAVIPEWEATGLPGHTWEGDNLIVTVGKQMILDRLYGLSAVGAMSRTGVGTSNTAAAVGNTSLTGGVFKAFDATPIRTSLTVASITTFGTADANITWAEMALDNGTTILNRIAPIGPFTKTTAVSIVVTVSVTQS